MALIRDIPYRAAGIARRGVRLGVLGLAAFLLVHQADGGQRFRQLRSEKAVTRAIDSELVLYQNGPSQRSGTARQIRELLSEFGATSYNFPREFTARVGHHISRYTGPDRPLMKRALTEYRGKINRMRQILRQEDLPTDLAYIPLVESGLAARSVSEAGAVGPWQLTAGAARAMGLRVSGAEDQRHDLLASTRAAARYLRKLISDLGAGNSVMLGLAAYNSGPARVREAIEVTADDPGAQISFWNLYRARALPAETREFVARATAAMIIGRSPERFGFNVN